MVICLVFFSWLDWGLGVWEPQRRSALRMIAYQGHTVTMADPCEVNLGHRPEVCLPGVLTVRFLFVLFHVALWEEVAVRSPPLQRVLLSLEAGHL